MKRLYRAYYCTSIRDVGYAHPGFAPYLARIRCPKIRCVHPSKWPFWLRVWVPQKNLACIRFRNDPCVHPFSESLKPNIRIWTSEFLDLVTGFLQQRMAPSSPDLKWVRYMQWDHLNYSTLCTKQRKFPLFWNFLCFVSLQKQSGDWQ